MKKVMCVLPIALIGIGAATVCSQGVERLDLDELRKKADSVLNQTNVSARRDIDVVFELADRLLEHGSKDAEHYLVQGLAHFPWNLEHQMVYAELLVKDGRTVQAREKADLVLQHGETDDLIERARKVLGKEPLPTFDQMKSLPGTNHCVVLVPLKEADKWLLLQTQKQLSAVLNIPVYIQATEMDYPPFGRDRRGVILNRIRRDLREDIDEPPVANALKDLGMTQEDLENEASLLRLLKALTSRAGTEAVAEFDAFLDQLRGKDPQWDADQLRAVMFRAVGPYRRENVAYIGITFLDIYAKDDNFLFGWANRRGGVMSYRRFTADFNDETPNQNRLIKRTLMQCLSSIGHVYGIERCTDPTCARAYPNSLSEHDAKKETLCSQCEIGFKKIFGQSPAGDPLKATPEE